MKRLFIAIALFSAACLLCLSGYSLLKSTNEQLDALLTESIACAQRQDEAGVNRCNRELAEKWNQARTVFAVMIQHSHLDDFERKINMLDFYAGRQDYGQYMEASREAKNELAHIMESEKVTIGNIF